MHVGCGFGGLTGLETGALGRQEISRTSVTLGGAFLASRQGDHRTVLLSWTEPRGLERAAPEKGLTKVLPSRSSWRGGLSCSPAPSSMSGHPGRRLPGPQMLWDLGKFLRNEMEDRLPGTTPRAQGAWKGMKGLCFEIIRNTCKAGGCQLAFHSSLQLPAASVVMGGPGGNALQRQQRYLKALDTGPTSCSRRKLVQPLLWAPEIIKKSTAHILEHQL